MESRVRASPEQFSTLLEYMESHGDLARPLTGAQGRVRSDRLWSDLTNILNSIGGGVNKTTEKWKKVWADIKSKTKKKALTLRQHARGTGGGPASRQTLSAMEERVLAIIGTTAVEGQDSIQELGFSRPQSSAPSQLSIAVAQETDDAVYMDNVVGMPSSVSPQPGTSFLSETQIELVQTPAPPRLVLAPPPNQTRPAASVSPAPESPAPPAPPAPTTPRRRRPAAASSAATPPSARRRLRAVSPDTPQSAASPARPRLRARRRHAPTPFERAASEFTAVELRRLELEEARIRQQNERDMRALEVEHERNQVFSSLVSIAQAWLDYYRSRDNTEPLNNE